MIMDFDTAFHKLLGHEGAYVNHPNDPGGETMWGVTARDADALAPARMLGLRLLGMTDMGGWPSFNKGWSRRVATLLSELK